MSTEEMPSGVQPKTRIPTDDELRNLRQAKALYKELADKRSRSHELLDTLWKNRDAPIDDEQWAESLLWGLFAFDKGGREIRHYFRDGSDDAKRGRQALARLLRSDAPLSRRIRTGLADLFDRNPIGLEDRTLAFKYRVRHRPKKVDHKAVGNFLWYHIEHKGRKAESAIKAAEDRFGLKRRRLLSIWSERKRGRL